MSKHFWYMALMWLSLSDPSALKMAKTLWGQVAMIGQRRDMTQSNWTKLVGYISPGCVNDFTVVGSGFNTWDAAFADAQLHPVMADGPYRGHITVTINVADPVSISTVQTTIDTNPPLTVATFPPNPPTVQTAIKWDFDTSLLVDGTHVLCAQVANSANLVGRTYSGYLFSTNQSTGRDGGSIGLPSMVPPDIELPPQPIVQKW
jgi:hypothetical protein